jgi:hypothetical protein
MREHDFDKRMGTCRDCGRHAREFVGWPCPGSTVNDTAREAMRGPHVVQAAEAEYLSLLRMPHGLERMGKQRELNAARDRLASLLGWDDERTQNHYEMLAAVQGATTTAIIAAGFGPLPDNPPAEIVHALCGQCGEGPCNGWCPGGFARVARDARDAAQLPAKAPNKPAEHVPSIGRALGAINRQEAPTLGAWMWIARRSAPTGE